MAESSKFGAMKFGAMVSCGWRRFAVDSLPTGGRGRPGRQARLVALREKL